MLHLKAPTTVVADYFRLFVNRRAYTLQSNRPHPESARHYYYRPKDKKIGRGLSLTLDTIRRHREGEITIGVGAVTRCVGKNDQAPCIRMNRQGKTPDGTTGGQIRSSRPRGCRNLKQAPRGPLSPAKMASLQAGALEL